MAVPDAAAVYTRQSHGKERSIAEQEAAGRAACEAEGWPVREVYKDTTSASRFARKGRPDWERLLADLDAGKFGVLVMWESSRGDRKLSSWAAMLDLCEERGVRIHVISHSRTYDPRQRRDWKTLADEGVDSADESKKTSERLLRAMSANAVNGRPHGTTLYGYVRIYDEHTRDLVGQREHPEHSRVVRKVFEWFADDVPLSRIAERLNERGIASPKGARWTRATVRQMLTNPGYVGRRRAGSTIKDRKFTTEYAGWHWPAIVDEATYWKVQRILGDPARKVTRPGRQKWLLSYIATCANCGAHLSVFRDGRWYGCSEHGCTYISREAADEYVSEWVIAWVERFGQEALAEGAASDEDALAAQAEADQLQAKLDEMAADLGLSARTLQIREAELLPKIKAAQERAHRAALPPVLAPFTGQDIRAGWYASALAARREVLKALVTVSVRRATRRSEPAYDRITVKQRS